MTLSCFNAGKFEETFEALRAACPDLSIDDFHLNLAQVSDHYYGNGGDQLVGAPRDLAARELVVYRSRRTATRTPSRWLETTFLNELDTYLQSGRTPMRCHSLRSSCFIDPWGTVFPCITYSKPIGSLRDHDMRLTPIWEGEKTRRLQGEIWNGECPQCWTACEAYQSILGNLFRPFDRIISPREARDSEPASLSGRRP
jgi:radical SAM protein with 4Fe4S-binding SPASM domain